MKTLYGLFESGDLWHKTIDNNHSLELDISAFRSDSAIFKLMDNVCYKVYAVETMI